MDAYDRYKILHQQGRYSEAASLYERSLEIEEDAMGSATATGSMALIPEAETADS